MELDLLNEKKENHTDEAEEHKRLFLEKREKLITEQNNKVAELKEEYETRECELLANNSSMIKEIDK